MQVEFTETKHNLGMRLAPYAIRLNLAGATLFLDQKERKSTDKGYGGVFVYFLEISDSKFFWDM